MNKQAALAQINDEIRAAVYAISEAEMAGLRGEAMLAVKRRLLVLKARHAAVLAA
ncbi:hypothetical protein [Bordetella phage FP1]|uniref:Uncharacterized protein n=1 Tax=Bordetella phage FP1 TaxID=1916125 RepID=A0A2D0W9K1_9CAUD|nr:hypothetical protein HOS31_gp40 [Bordetella phage FP1]APL99339.1 hypothetical protein [Bordetella phage FP1]